MPTTMTRRRPTSATQVERRLAASPHPGCPFWCRLDHRVEGAALHADAGLTLRDGGQELQLARLVHNERASEPRIMVRGVSISTQAARELAAYLLAAAETAEAASSQDGVA